MASTSIFHQYLRPVRSVSEYAADLDKDEANQLEIAGKRRANAVGERDYQEANAIRALLQTGVNLDTPEGQRRVLGTAPKIGMEILKNRAEMNQKAATAGKDVAHKELYSGQAAALKQKEALANQALGLGFISDPAHVSMWIEQGRASGAFPEEVIPRLTQSAQAALQNGGIQEFVNSTRRALVPIVERFKAEEAAARQNTTEQGLNQRFAGVSGNTAATVQGQNQRHITMTPYQQGQLANQGARTLYETGTQPLPTGGAPAAPTTTQEFPRVTPQAQGAMDAEARRIKEAELREINAGLGMPQTPEDTRRMQAAKAALERELGGGGGGGDAGAQPQSQKARDALIVASNKQNPQGKPLPAPALKLQQEELDAIGTAASINADLAAINKLLATNKLNLGPIKNVIAQGRNAAGLSDENSRNLTSFKATLERLRNDSLRLNKGVQTEGDAQRAWNEVVTNINDPGVVRQRLSEIDAINKRAITLRRMNIDNIRQNYGHSPLDTSRYETQPSGIGQTQQPGGMPSMSDIDAEIARRRGKR
jgi:hypothetical protein